VSQSKITNMAASVRERLANTARNANRPFQEILQYYTMERFLYRLGKSAHARKFVLKGALMFTIWRTETTRPTLDIDLLGTLDNSPETIIGVAKDIIETKVEDDGLIFDPRTLKANRISEDADYTGVRVRFLGRLGSARVNMQIDIGFGDLVVPASEKMKYPTLLPLSAPTLWCYSRESTIAEKFEAMVKLDILNSRMKDFFDLWIMSKTFSFSGRLLQQAIRTTFQKRGTDLPRQIPTALAPEFSESRIKKAQWTAFFHKIHTPSETMDLPAVVRELETFLMPPVRASITGEEFCQSWKPGGPWTME